MADFTNVYNFVAKWVASKLDKLKIKNPIVFILIQSTALTVLGLFVANTINLPDIALLVKIDPALASDNLVIGFLGALVALISPRTSVLTAQYNGTV